MNYSNTISFPIPITSQDINSLFCGLLSLIKEQAKEEAKKQQLISTNSYRHLLSMYKDAIKRMNKYKYLYLKTINYKII